MEAVVTFEYQAQQEDELTLKVGQVLKNVHIVDEGWAEGELFGKVGMFPDNFVEMRKALPEDRPPAPVPKDDRPPPPVAKEERAPANIPTPQKASSSKRLLRATFDYSAVNDDELTLKVGDIVEFLGDEEEGWYKGLLKGKTGVFPSNFVEELPPSVPPSSASATDGKQPPPTPASEIRPSKPPPPIPNDAVNHHEDTPPSTTAVRTPAFGGKQVLPVMGELPMKPSDLKKRPPPPQTAAADKPDKPPQAPPPTVAKPKKEAPPPPLKKDRPPVMPKTQSKPDLAPESATDHATGENDFEGLPEHRLLDHVQRAKGPPRKPPSQSHLAESKSPEPEEASPAAKPQPAWARKSSNSLGKSSEPPARPAAVPKPAGPSKAEPKPPPPASSSAGQGNTELMAALEALKQDFKKLRDEYRNDIDNLMADLDQERKKVRSLEVDVDRLKKRSNRENL